MLRITLVLVALLAAGSTIYGINGLIETNREQAASIVLLNDRIEKAEAEAERVAAVHAAEIDKGNKALADLRDDIKAREEIAIAATARAARFEKERDNARTALRTASRADPDFDRCLRVALPGVVLQPPETGPTRDVDGEYDPATAGVPAAGAGARAPTSIGDGLILAVEYQRSLRMCNSKIKALADWRVSVLGRLPQPGVVP